ncbi:D-alanine--D-alanine ligase [Candidatus Saccharibacteria bacterium]|nr:D-alanine--D-alanine ligase [Candidatus Saccharibacteria bacterium]
MKTKIAVFFGGNSVEHEVSIITALQAIENIDRKKYEVLPIYITKDSRMYTGEKIGNIANYNDIPKLLQESTQVTPVNLGEKVALLRVEKKLFERAIYDFIDIAFPIVHGTNVEDGTIEGFVKMLNIPYVGCDVLSSALGMDKYACKEILRANNIPVIDGKLYDIKQYKDDETALCKDIEKTLGFPVITKPVNLGSSVGISIAKDSKELKESLEEAFTYASKILVEKAIMNLKEVNCSVIGDHESAKASECESPIKMDQILSYRDKYLGNGTKGAKRSKTTGVKGSKNNFGGTMGSDNSNPALELPAKISTEQKKTIQELAVKTFQALGCNGVIRIDFIINQDDNKIYVNEVNTIPGSLSFHLWRETGMSYAEELNEIISLGLKRAREEKNLTFSFETNVLANFNGAKAQKLHK